MKRASAFLAFLVFLFFAGLALANTATVTTLNGTAQAQAGPDAPARTLRVGDLVRQGDTVITGAGSSVVLRFEDGQVTALTPNSRLTITAYQYDAQTQQGNVLLSLITGGMRAVTGLIGNRSPDRVAYRAANATVGIRGTDINLIVHSTTPGSPDITVLVQVNAGIVSYTIPGFPTVTVNAGQAVATSTSQRTGPAVGAAAAVIAALPPALQVTVVNDTGAINSLATQIQQAVNQPTNPSRDPVTVVTRPNTTPAGGTGVSGAACSGHGTATVTSGTTFCNCDAGFSGSQCQNGG